MKTLIENNYLMSILPESIPTFWNVNTSEDSKEAMKAIDKFIDHCRGLDMLDNMISADEESSYCMIGDNCILLMGPVNVVISAPEVKLL